MSPKASDPHRRNRRVLPRHLLLAGVSLVALTAHAPVEAASLRGRSVNPAAAATAAATSAAQLAATASAQALVRVNNSLRAMRDTQALARAAALAAASTVPNGLTAGGLVVAPGATPSATDGGSGLWQGADLPTQSTTAAGRTQVEVKQNQQKAILTWSSFNVGRETDLYFNQTAGGSDVANWIALNRVIDPSFIPSQILGSIKAEGQVYVINNNGIIFGGTSQINVGTLVASSLSLSNDQFLAGINTQLRIDVTGGNHFGLPTFGDYTLQEPDTSLAACVPGAACTTGQAAPYVPASVPGDVIVQAGAEITIASGGNALLFAPRVTNAGIISAKDGQVMLAAGEQVWLSTRYDLTGEGEPVVLRGLDVAVSAPSTYLLNYGDYAGGAGIGTAYNAFARSLGTTLLPVMEERAATVGYKALNTGIIVSERGVITMQSREVEQQGILYATTALNNLAGEIVLRAWGQGMLGWASEKFSTTNGQGMVWWSPGTLTLAPGSVTLVMPDPTDTSTIELTSVETRYTPGSIDLRGKLIDIEGGADVMAPNGAITMVASARTTARAAPVSGESVRDGSRIYIDSGAYVSVAGLTDTVLEMASNIVAVDVRINELRDSVLYRDSWLRGTTIYVDKRESGTFADGPMAGVEWVKDDAGNVIPGAWVGTPLVDAAGWVGTGNTTLAELSTKGGTITLKSGGDIITRQGSTLDVSGGAVTYTGGIVQTTKLIGADGKLYDISEATPDRIYVGFAGDKVVTHEHWGITEVYSSPLRRTGGRYEAGYTEGRSAGSLVIYQGSGLVLEGGISGGVITGERQAASGKGATAGTLTIGGTGDEQRSWLASEVIITADPVRLAGGFTSTSALPSDFYHPVTGNEYKSKTVYLDDDMLNDSGLGKIGIYYNQAFTVAADADLELAPGASFTATPNTGVSEPSTAAMLGSIRIAGGTVTIYSGTELTLGAGAVVDVSGQWVNDVFGIDRSAVPAINGGTIKLAATATTAVFEVGEGAVLDVSGGAWLTSTRKLKSGDAGAIELQVPTTGFADLDLRGYAPGSGGSLSLTARGAVDVQIGGAAPADPATLRLPATLFADRGFRSLNVNTAGDIVVADDAAVSQLPTSIDLAGVDLAAFATGTPISAIGRVRVLDPQDRLDRAATSLSLSGDTITVGVGARLTADAGGAIALGAANAMTVAGTVVAPGGSITLSAVTLRLTETARLTAAGTAVSYVDPSTRLRTADVLAGGTVTLSTEVLTIDPRARIDVSGASAVIDDPASGRGQTRGVAVASDGGSIEIRAGGTVEGQFTATAGGAGAAGGSITLQSYAGSILVSAGAAPTTGSLLVRPDVLNSGGFASIVLTGPNNVLLDGVDLVAARSISIAGVVTNVGGGSSSLSAPYLKLDRADTAGVAAGATAGTLTLNATVIDALNAIVRGFATTAMTAQDIRLVARATGETARLDVDGTLTLTAAQVYPSTQTPAVVSAVGTIRVRPNGTADAPLSAGGSLILQAPEIDVTGTLRAPFGAITLTATDSVTLGDGALVSVSGDGLSVPYGTLVSNESWVIATGYNTTATLTAPPEKRITIDAPVVDQKAGATIDIRGGGDLLAAEFAAGPGGSHDVLAMSGMYAIVPASSAIVAPIGAIGNRIWLAGGNGIAAGWYALLPAPYARLPGAYAVQVVKGTSGTALAKSATLADGTTLMAGRLGNSLDGSSDALNSVWRVMSGAVVRKYTEYNEATANSFFASDAFKLIQYRLTGVTPVTPRLPMDGGSVVFKATEALVLDGLLRSQAADGGRGGLVDIAATNIAVVGEGADTSGLAGYLLLDATQLSAFGAESLLIGGVRSGTMLGLAVAVTADSIVVRNDADTALSGGELILVAKDNVGIEAGSVLRVDKAMSGDSVDLIMTPAGGTSDYGGLIRLSNGEAVSVIRTGVVSSQGTVTIGGGAVLAGGRSLTIDATRDAVLAGSAVLSGEDITLGSSRIGFGGGSEGLVFEAATLARFASATNLTLRSYSTIDFHTGIDFGSAGLASVTLDAVALVGMSAGTTAVSGKTIVLRNTTGATAVPTSTALGTLRLSAEDLVLGIGAKALRGFGNVEMTASRRMIGNGAGSLDAGAAALRLVTPLITGQASASQSIVTTGTLAVAPLAGAPASRDTDSLGSQWAFTGGAVEFGSRVDAIGGGVTLMATAGDLTVTAGALIDVGGLERVFYDVAEYADAGRIGLTAFGDLTLAAGATLDLAAASGGGDGGDLSAIASGGGSVVLAGTIRAAAPNGQGGSFSLDIDRLPDFAAFGDGLTATGFTGARSFRIRTGDVTIDGFTTASEFRLSADTGTVTIAGTIDARATYGGIIEIYGGTGLTMDAGAKLYAGATDTVDHLGSGRVTLGISAGSLDVRGLIDVAGGEGGKVTLRAPVVGNTVNVAFAGTIADGAKEIVLEGFKIFNLADLANPAVNPNFVGVTINAAGQAELDLAATAAGKLNVLADYGAGTLVEFVQDFDISAAYGHLGGLAAKSNFHARPGMQLDYAGDIVLKSNWNLGAGTVNQATALAAGVMAIDPVLTKAYVVAGKEGELLRDHTTMVYRTGGSILGESGVLTLRAEGDIELKGSISDGFFQFANPLDADYVDVNGQTTSNTTVVFNGGRSSTAGALTVFTATGTSLPSRYAGLTFSSAGVLTAATTTKQTTNVPYSADANSPAASSPNALEYAVLFPAVTKGDGSVVSPSSWSQTLVAGAAPLGESADPARLAAASTGSILLSEQASYTYVDSQTSKTAVAYIDGAAAFGIATKPTAANGTVDPANWLDALETAAGTYLTSTSSSVFTLGASTDPAYGYLTTLWNDYAAANGLTAGIDFRLVTSSSRVNVVMAYSTFEPFYNAKILPNISAIALLFNTAQAGSTTATVTPTTMVRTGTGDIAVVAAKDVRLNHQAVIYTAGRRDTTVYNDFSWATRYLSNNVANAKLTDPVWAVDGGHLTIKAGGSVNANMDSDEGQAFSEWLQRIGEVTSTGVFVKQSAWWVDPAAFDFGVGAMGGGNVTVSAGDDLVDLGVYLPTNALVRGGRTLAEAKTLVMHNGGALDVSAGGTIYGGQYYIGRGDAEIAAGAITTGRTFVMTKLDSYTPAAGTSRNYTLGTVLALGDATMKVSAAGDIAISTVVDPLRMSMPYGPVISGTSTSTYDYKAYMSDYTSRTALDLFSVGGNVTLLGAAGDGPLPGWSIYTYLSPGYWSTSVDYTRWVTQVAQAINRYPSKTTITALNGSITNNTALNFMSDSDFRLTVLAAADVTPGTINMGQVKPANYVSPYWPNGSTTFVSNSGDLLQTNDYEPSRIYALHGSILGAPTSRITANEQMWFQAGTDIRNLNLTLRNVHESDVSWLNAGNDILDGSITIWGPGGLLLTAGRDVYAGSMSILSTGNTPYTLRDNLPDPSYLPVSGLPEAGASIEIIAGLNGKQPDYDAFAAAYLDPAKIGGMASHLTTTVNGVTVPLYLTDASRALDNGDSKQTRYGLVSFIKDTTGETLSPLAAWQRFQSLPALTQQRFLRQIYMQELRAAGRDQNEGLLSGGYNRGYAAIASLFPGDGWNGNIVSNDALIRTMQGGDITLMAPGGGVQLAALQAAPGGGQGAVTLGYGDIEIFAKDDLVVNNSRILTFAGGDITVWSSVGDIDAGRGKKTTRVPTPPTFATDADGLSRTVEKADIGGSGIGTVLGYKEVEPGDVDLIAPEGTVNAGDAGIRVAGDFNVAARFVLNMDNVKVGGESKGVPKEDTKVAPLAVETKDKAAAEAVETATRQATTERPSVIIVEILGYGGPSGEDNGTPRRDDACAPGGEACGERRSQDPTSRYQVVGVGALTEEEALRLADDKRRQLGR